MAEIPFITDPSEVTPAWLTSVLREAGFAVTVGDVESESVGTGQVARCERFFITFEISDARAPRTLVGKFPSPNPLSRSTGRSGAYPREVSVYGHVLPTVRIRTPHVYWVDLDEASGDFVLLMEDMAPARQGDQLRGCSATVAEAAVEEAARLHAPRWGDPTLPRLDFLARPADTATRVERYHGFWEGFLKRYASRLNEEILEVGRGLALRYGTYSRPYPGPRCVTHGDFRLDNMLIDETDGVRLAVVDWQTAGIGCGMQDVAYFLGAGLLPDERRRDEEALVRRYHAALVDAGVGDYSFDQAWRDYHWYSYAGYVMAVTASMLVVQTDRGDEMFMTMARRHAQQAIDHGAEALLDAAV